MVTGSGRSDEGAGRAPDRPGPSAALAAELAAADAALSGAPAEEAIAWAYERFGDGVLLTSSFQDCVLVHLATSVRSPLEVVFLDTGFHFPETLEYLVEVQDRFDLEVVVLDTGLPPTESPCGSPDCCARRKVEPLEAALAGRSAWLTGVKRVDTPERAAAPVVGFDQAKGVVKVNPLAAWSEADVETYAAANDLPRHPLNARGYRSIGCAPTTRAVAPGEDPRAGRFDGTKTECGLHL